MFALKSSFYTVLQLIVNIYFKLVKLNYVILFGLTGAVMAGQKETRRALLLLLFMSLVYKAVVFGKTPCSILSLVV